MVLGRIDGSAQDGIVRIAVVQAGIVAGGDQIRAVFFGPVQKDAELQIFVTPQTGAGGLTLGIGFPGRGQDPVVKGLGAVDDMKGNAQAVSNRLGSF